MAEVSGMIPEQAPQEQSSPSAFDAYWESIPADEQVKLQPHKSGIHAWFSVAEAWVGGPLRAEIADLRRALNSASVPDVEGMGAREQDESEDIYPDYQDAVARLHASESREQAMREELELMKSMASSEAPCGHPQQYCLTGDGGKHIVCLMCEYEDREAMRECLREGASLQGALTSFQERQEWQIKAEKLLKP